MNIMTNRLDRGFFKYQKELVLINVCGTSKVKVDNGFEVDIIDDWNAGGICVEGIGCIQKQTPIHYRRSRT